MKTTRIELEGPAGTVTIQSEGRSIRIDSILRDPRGEQAWMTWTVGAIADDQELFEIAAAVQRRCDGHRGTNSDIHDYYRELQRFAD
jgi:hypothetical protein